MTIHINTANVRKKIYKLLTNVQQHLSIKLRHKLL